MIDQQTIAKIFDAAQIVDVVSDFVTLKKRGVNYVGLCPFHDEKTGSFTVSPSKGIYKCFGCGKGGNAVNFIMEHEKLDYPGALRFLAKKYHIDIVEKELTEEEKHKQDDRESMFALNEFASKYFSDILHNHPEGKAVGISYFRERQFSDKTIEKFQLGYCLNEKDAFAKAAIDKGFKTEFIEKCGLSIKYDNGSFADRFRGRVMFPVHTLSGKIVAFGGRVLKKDEKTAKYVNSPESEIYHKSDELYGIFFAKQNIVKHDRCFLVEGYTDVISMHQSGVENVVASSGTSLTHGQIRLIHRFTENITVLYDGDAAGIKASLRGIDLLLAEGMNIKVVLLPDGEDPDSYARTHDASEFIDYIEKNQVDFIKFKTNLLLDDIGDDPIKKAALIGDVVNSIAVIPSQITRSVYVKECSSLLDVDETILLTEINKILRKQKDDRLKEIQRQKQLNANYVNGSTDKSKNLPENISPDSITFVDKFQKHQLNILFYVVRYGEIPIFFDDQTQKNITVGEFIADEMAKNELIFKSPVYSKMLDAYISHKNDNDFKASSFYVENADPEISQIAAELMTDRYVESRIFEKQENFVPDKTDKAAYEDYMRLKKEEFLIKLGKSSTRVVYEYLDAVINDQIKQRLHQLKQIQSEKDEEKTNALFKDIQELTNKRNAVAKILGERVVVKH